MPTKKISQTFVAFLRGINVGGKNIIKMEALRLAFEKMGFQSVRTYIQSGNVIFESEMTDEIALEKKIENTLKSSFRYEAKVMIRSKADLKKTVLHFPTIFQDTAWKHNVIFLGHQLDSKDILKKFTIKPDIEQINYFKGTLFWSAKLDSISRSTMLKLSTKPEYQEMTVRNTNTTKKIFELIKI